MITCVVPSNDDRVFEVFAKSYFEAVKLPLVVIYGDGLSEGIRKKYGYVSFLPEPDPFSVYAAVNVGINFASDNDVVVICDDVYIHTVSIIKKLRMVAYANDDIGITVPLVSNVVNNVQAPVPLEYDVEFVNGYPYITTSQKVNFEFAFLKRSVINRVGMFDEGYKWFRGDVDYNRRCLNAGYVNAVSYAAYVQHGGPMFGRNAGNTTGVLTQEDVAPDYEHWNRKWGVV